MARPDRHMVAPAMACVWRSRRFSFAKLNPHADTMTTVSIVPMVVAAKTSVTRSIPKKLWVAAGYMSIGINGSHGPSTKMVNTIQGVSFCPSSL